MAEPFDGATGALARFVPEGAERDELLGLVRIGIKFAQQQHAGRRPGFLHHYLVGLVGRMGEPATFERLLAELQVDAARRNRHGESPIEHCSRSMEVLIYHDPKRGRLEIGFPSLRNALTKSKREISSHPVLNESDLKESPHAARLAENKRGLDHDER